MAQAAWTRPTLNLSSWSCIGPRHRVAAARSNSKEGSAQESSLTETETIEPSLTSAVVTGSATMETINLPVSSSGGLEWSSETECSCSADIHREGIGNVDISDGEDLMGHGCPEDSMNEVELWQQLEHELYENNEGNDADVRKEIREEEAAAMAEVGSYQEESNAPEPKEVHRFFPAGKIMHIITLLTDTAEHNRSSSSSSESTESLQQVEPKIGIFLTPRSLYSKLRLSQSMINDHFMPIYRRQIEKLIKELEDEHAHDSENGTIYEQEVL